MRSSETKHRVDHLYRCSEPVFAVYRWTAIKTVLPPARLDAPHDGTHSTTYTAWWWPRHQAPPAGRVLSGAVCCLPTPSPPNHSFPPRLLHHLPAISRAHTVLPIPPPSSPCPAWRPRYIHARCFSSDVFFAASHSRPRHIYPLRVPSSSSSSLPLWVSPHRTLLFVFLRCALCRSLRPPRGSHV